MTRTGTPLEQLLGPSPSERLVSAMERQATALERLVQLGEVALGLDPPTLAAAAEAAAVVATPGSVEISDGPDKAAIRKIEEITLALASVKGVMPTDEEIHAELNRQEQVEANAARYAAGLSGMEGLLGERGGFLG